MASGKRILGVDVAELETEHDVRRQHPSAESSSPPPARQPPKRSLTPFDLEIRDIRPRIEQAPLPESRRTYFPRGAPSWAVGAVMVIGAIGSAVTGALVVSATRAPSAKPAEVVRVDSETLSRDRAQNAYLESLADDQVVRDTVMLAYLCWQNGGVPPARGVECPEVKCVPKPLIRDGKVVPKQLACVVDVPWPTLRKPPKH